MVTSSILLVRFVTAVIHAMIVMRIFVMIAYVGIWRSNTFSLSVRHAHLPSYMHVQQLEARWP